MKMTMEQTTNKVDIGVLPEVKYLPVGDQDYEQFRCEKEVKRPATWFLNFVIITGLTPLLVGGSSMTWSSSAILKLKSNNSDINPLGHPVTTAEISKLLGIPGILGLLGCSLLPKCADYFGRKRSYQVISFAMFVGIIGLAFSQCLELMLTFLTITSICFQGMGIIFPIYLIEICEDHYRAKYCILMSSFFSLGQLYCYVIGPLFSLKNFTLLVAVPMVPFLVLFFIAPESPIDCLKKGKREECIQTLQRLRNYRSSKELTMDYKAAEVTLLASNKQKGSAIMELFCTKENRIGLMLGLLPVIIQNLSGVMILMPLMAPIFNDSNAKISGNTIAICVGIIKFCSFSFTSFIIERVGNRPLLIVSSALTGLPVSVLGLYFYLKYINSPILPHLQWVPLVCVLLYLIGYSLGIGNIPDSLLTIFFNSDLRSMASAFIMTTAGIILAGYLSIYPLLDEAIGTHWCMWIFGVTCFLGAVLFYIIMPETKGKSILEIQEILQSYKFFEKK